MTFTMRLPSDAEIVGYNAFGEENYYSKKTKKYYTKLKKDRYRQRYIVTEKSLEKLKGMI